MNFGVGGSEFAVGQSQILDRPGKKERVVSKTNSFQNSYNLPQQNIDFLYSGKGFETCLEDFRMVLGIS